MAWLRLLSPEWPLPILAVTAEELPSDLSLKTVQALTPQAEWVPSPDAALSAGDPQWMTIHSVLPDGSVDAPLVDIDFGSVDEAWWNRVHEMGWVILMISQKPLVSASGDWMEWGAFTELCVMPLAIANYPTGPGTRFTSQIDERHLGK